MYSFPDNVQGFVSFVGGLLFCWFVSFYLFARQNPSSVYFNKEIELTGE